MFYNNAGGSPLGEVLEETALVKKPQHLSPQLILERFQGIPRPNALPPVVPPEGCGLPLGLLLDSED